MTDKPTPIAPKREAKAAPSKRPVSEHGRANYPSAGRPGGQRGVGRPHPELWKHSAAAALHCWGQHAHHMAAEMELSDSDYAKAIEAASAPNNMGEYVPHKAASFVLKTEKAD